MSEDQIQAAIVEYVRAVAPDCLIHSVPNGAFLAGATEKQRARQMARLKWTGLLPGAFDLVFYAPGGIAAAIEVKTPTGILGWQQKDVRERYIALGVRHLVARGIPDMRAALQTWGVVTREAA